MYHIAHKLYTKLVPRESFITAPYSYQIMPRYPAIYVNDYILLVEYTSFLGFKNRTGRSMITQVVEVNSSYDFNDVSYSECIAKCKNLMIDDSSTFEE